MRIVGIAAVPRQVPGPREQRWASGKQRTTCRGSRAGCVRQVITDRPRPAIT